MKVTAGKISEFLGVAALGTIDVEVCTISKLLPGEKNSLSFCKLNTPESMLMIENTLSSVVICPIDLDPNLVFKDKTLIPVTNPRLSFAQAAQKFFPWRKVECGIHPTAVISSGAEIDKSASIGPYCIISEGVKIGENSVLFGHVVVYPNCKIGNRVIINSGTVIGSEGFGYVRDEDDNQIQFPHIGGVIIENDVEIGSNTCIDRGALGDTTIGQGTKIDNLVHVAHNVVVGKNCCIICQVGIGGSVEIGDNSWIGISASIKNQKKIGKNVMVGMGAVVTKDVPDDTTVVGNPARPMVK